MSAYRRPDRCAWCCARLTPQNAAVVGPELVCRDCADTAAFQAIVDSLDERLLGMRAPDAATAPALPWTAQQQRTAMKATTRGIGGH